MRITAITNVDAVRPEWLLDYLRELLARVDEFGKCAPQHFTLEHDPPRKTVYFRDESSTVVVTAQPQCFASGGTTSSPIVFDAANHQLRGTGTVAVARASGLIELTVDLKVRGRGLLRPVLVIPLAIATPLARRFARRAIRDAATDFARDHQALLELEPADAAALTIREVCASWSDSR